MSVEILGIEASPTLQATRVATPPNANLELTIFTGIVLMTFKGNEAGIARDVLSFNLRDPNEELAELRLDIDSFRGASGTVSLTSFAYDGPVNDALWAIDSTSVELTNEDRGTETANVQVAAGIAVRGANGVILRVCYAIYVQTFSGAIVILP